VRAGFLLEARDYFFSSGFDSLGEAGEVGVVVELDEAAPPAAPAPVAPVPLVELLDVSAPGAGVGVVAVEDDGALGDDAGGGVTTVLSSFLPQATSPTATRAAMRSERFIIFPLGEHHTGCTENGRRKLAVNPTSLHAIRERPTRSS
jgi:hypothetical protein